MRDMHALGGAFWGRALVSTQWRKLCFVGYAVDPALLAANLPPGLSLDLFGERAVVSLCAWTTSYPRVLGIELPKQPASTELALRYYVREGVRRGAVTLQEDSSSPFAALAARALFREPARRASVRASIAAGGEQLQYGYELVQGDRLHRLSVRVARAGGVPEVESLAYFLTHRPYGYARSPDGELLRYDIEHPRWTTHEVLESDIDVDFGALYGASWAELARAKPLGVVLAEGSPVRVSLPE